MKTFRHSLTSQVAREAAKYNSDVATITKLIGARSGADIYDSTMNYLNNFKTQASVRQNAAALTDALAGFLVSTRTNAAKIAANIKR